MRWRWLVWFAFLIAWSAALLSEAPVALARSVLRWDHRVPASKVLHVAAYAAFTVLSGWLRPTGRLRWWLVAFLCCHALGSEVLQGYVPTRTPSWLDVGLNLLGISIGLFICWKWLGAGKERRLPS